MPVSYGKQFEKVIGDSFKKAKNTYVLRLPDQTSGYLGSVNPCDFIIYNKNAGMFGIECKTIHGNTFPLSNISKNQWNSLLQMEKFGIHAGVICWWVDRDTTKFLPIRLLQHIRALEWKSIKYWDERIAVLAYPQQPIDITGKKKRVFFDYNMEAFFNEFI